MNSLVCGVVPQLTTEAASIAVVPMSPASAERARWSRSRSRTEAGPIRTAGTSSDPQSRAASLRRSGSRARYRCPSTSEQSALLRRPGSSLRRGGHRSARAGCFRESSGTAGRSDESSCSARLRRETRLLRVVSPAEQLLFVQITVEPLKDVDLVCAMLSPRVRRSSSRCWRRYTRRSRGLARTAQHPRGPMTSSSM